MAKCSARPITSLREYGMNVSNGYSADVRLQLIVGERVFEVEQVLRDTCVLSAPIDHAPCDAELVMHVDGRRRSWSVALPEGIRSNCPDTRLS